MTCFLCLKLQNNALASADMYGQYFVSVGKDLGWDFLASIFYLLDACVIFLIPSPWAPFCLSQLFLASRQTSSLALLPVSSCPLSFWWGRWHALQASPLLISFWTLSLSGLSLVHPLLFFSLWHVLWLVWWFLVRGTQSPLFLLLLVPP